MKIYAISDLHLSFSAPPDIRDWRTPLYKPMSEVDPAWQDHPRRIYENWCEIIRPEDIVLVPGDISWAMRLEETVYDMQYLENLPGNIILVQGNHDYWWQSLSRVRAALPPNTRVIQNDSVDLGEVQICGTRGWQCPNSAVFGEHDQKIYRRELIRLENSLQSAAAKNKKIIVMMHYMPTNEKHEYSGFVELMHKFSVSTVVYGHLHARACRYRLPDHCWGINFYLVSADYLNFRPRLVYG